MGQIKRAPTFLAVASLLITLLYFSRTRDLYPRLWSGSQKIPLGSQISTSSNSSQISSHTTISGSSNGIGAKVDEDIVESHDSQQHDIVYFQGGGEFEKAEGLHDPHDGVFLAGSAKPPGSKYSRTLIVAKTIQENTDWIFEEDLGDFTPMIYVADDPFASLRTPQNKGREAMVYLTHMIDNYDNLSDVNIFMHSHRFAWHNMDILNFDATEVIKRLSNERVQRVGYMNLRCQWAPGCPNWMHPGTTVGDTEKEEEVIIAEAWTEIFPGKPIPKVLAQTCCSQFALSRDKIRAVPREAISRYRDWLRRTPLDDKLSGRVWEYLWQAIFTGYSVYCPEQYGCYCDGYGICFEDEKAFDYWWELDFKKKNLENELKKWKEQSELIESYRHRGELFDIEGSNLEIPEPNKDVLLEVQIRQFEQHKDELKWTAIKRGTDPGIRAASVGRKWKAGDGY